MPRPRRSTATALRPAIEALRWDLARFELQCVETRELIAQLCKRAGIVDEIKPVEQAEAKKRMSDGGKKKTSGKVSTPSGKTRDKIAKVVGKGKGSSGGAKSEPPDKDAATLAELGVGKRQQPKPEDRARAAELRKIVAAIAESDAKAKDAAAEKNVEKLKAAVEAVGRAQRAGGVLLVAMGGRMKLPISKLEAKRFRRAAELMEEEFLAKSLRAQKRAVKSLGAPAKKPAKKRTPARRPSRSPPHPVMRLSPFVEGPDGALTRTLTGVDPADAGAEAPSCP